MILVAWSILCFLSFGIPAFIFILMRRAATKPWRIKIDKKYRPKISIIVPTYNESDTIHFKLENLRRVEYPNELMEIVIVDSKSSDNTIDIVNKYERDHQILTIKTLIEDARKGKSAALNLALKHCNGDVVIISDADCFWSQDMLKNTLPFLAEPNVGAISGSKVLLNAEHTWVTRSEQAYMNSSNLIKLGESKTSSTLVFEGGFAAFKRSVIEAFDPYSTGSDDTGTVIHVLEKNFRALHIPEATFFSIFPLAWKDRTSIKIRRANQFVRVFSKYALLLLKGRIRNSRRIVIQNVFLYLISPLLFLSLVVMTIFALFTLPYIALIFLIFTVPKIGLYAHEVIQGYIVLLHAMLSTLLQKRFLIWEPPKDRTLLTKMMLQQHGLI